MVVIDGQALLLHNTKRADTVRKKLRIKFYEK